MQKLSQILVSVALFALAGCANDTEQTPVAVVSAANWSVIDVRVSVPRDLRATEANDLLPDADIVWHGEPLGDRHVQVGMILDQGITKGLQHLNGKQRVYFDVTATRFHALTDKARSITGGVYGLKYIVNVRDAKSGAVVLGPVAIDASVNAPGGARARADDKNGNTQRVQIINRLAEVTAINFPAR